MSDLSAAAVNFEPVYGDIEANLLRLSALVEVLAAQGVELALFPEMCLTGYGHEPDICSLAQPVPGELTRRLEELARRSGMAFIAGLPERDVDDGAPYVSQMLFTSDGLAGVYRKVHLHRREAAAFRAGNSVPVFRWRGINIGLQLCYDTHFPELSACQALAGAGLLCLSFATPMGTAEELLDRWKRYLPARAYDNSCCLLACNQAGVSPRGTSFAGAALALDAQGRLLAECASAGEDILRVTLTEEMLQGAADKRFLPYRRPQVYDCEDARGKEYVE